MPRRSVETAGHRLQLQRQCDRPLRRITRCLMGINTLPNACGVRRSHHSLHCRCDDPVHWAMLQPLMTLIMTTQEQTLSGTLCRWTDSHRCRVIRALSEAISMHLMIFTSRSTKGGRIVLLGRCCHHRRLIRECHRHHPPALAIYGHDRLFRHLAVSGDGFWRLAATACQASQGRRATSKGPEGSRTPNLRQLQLREPALQQPGSLPKLQGPPVRLPPVP